MFTALRPVAALTLLAAALSAQTSRSGSYYKSIGNSWLGGSASAYAGVSTSQSSNTLSTTRSGNASLSAYVRGSILTYSLTAVELTASASNSVTQFSRLNLTQQRASAGLRLKLAGFTVWDRSVTTTGDLGGITPRTYNLFPSDVRAPVGVGPFTLTLGANAGVTLNAGAVAILPTTAPSAQLLLSGGTAVQARAYVSIGVFGFGAGVELQGRFAEMRLTCGLTANALTGLSASCGLTLQPMSLRLVAFLEALWRRVYETTLTSWSFGGVNYDLLTV
ncbi:MAG: hypothetical protein R3F56_19520 [Planctomycetota bacterium]